jgi:acetoin utilization protein AcuB
MANLKPAPDVSPAVDGPAAPVTVGAVMSRQVVTVDIDAHLDAIRESFHQHQFHHLLVLDRGRLAGIISDRDLLRAVSPFLGTFAETERDVATLHKRAHQIMSRHLVSVTPQQSVEEAARLLIERKVSCLPVVAPGGTVEGILTSKDLLKAIAQLWSAPAVSSA